MAEQESLIFGTLDQLLMDKRLKFSMLAGQVCLCLCVCLFWRVCVIAHVRTEQGPVLAKLKKELKKFWGREACKGRTIEECARFDNLCGIDIFVESYHFQGLGAP